MTDQERQLIQGLITRIQNAPAPQVDRDADELIRRGLGSRPDAIYILTQTVLIQEMALTQAKAQIDELKQRAGSPQPNSSFLGAGGSSPAPASQSPSQGGYQGSSYQRDNYPPPPPQQAPPQYEVPPPQTGGRFSGFLHNAAQTAAGVIAGEVAFSALSSIFGGHGGGYGGGFGGGSGFFGGSSGISPGSETIINNYYGDEHDRGSGGGFSSSDGGLSPDVEDRRFAGDGSTDDGSTDDSRADDNSGDDNSADDSSLDDGSTDDSSSYDDGSDSSDQ